MTCFHDKEGVNVSGEVIDATFAITAKHNGFVNFTLCPNNNVKRAATEDCFNRSDDTIGVLISRYFTC